MGQLFVISGPSGAGKSTVIWALRARVPDLGYSVSHTTRPPREDEKDGEAYHFVDEAAFRSMISRGEFAEWAEVYGRLYGTAFKSIDRAMEGGKDLVLDVDTQGARHLRQCFPDCVLIFVLPPSLEALRARLCARGAEDAAEIARRMQSALNQIRECAWFHYLVVNEVLEDAVHEVEAVIIAERCRSARRIREARKRFGI